MRTLCKEEDYEFLGSAEKLPNEATDGAGALEDDVKDIKEERVRDETPTVVTMQPELRKH